MSQNNQLKSEARVSQEIELEAAKQGVLLLRNNVGVATDLTGRPVRYGLANKSKQMNQQIKSADLVGVTPIVITPDMVGQVVGVFTSIEVKKEGWVFTGTTRELAQQKWENLIKSYGGIAQFATSVEDVKWHGKG